MIKQLRLLLLFTFYWNIEAEERECYTVKYSAYYEYSCPLDSEQKIILQIHPRKFIEMLCINFDLLNHTIIPDINFGENYISLYIKGCPIPQNGFQELLKAFHLKQINYLFHIRYPNEKFRVEYFQGLESLTTLSLVENHIKYFDHNILKILIQLSTLDLSNNKLILYGNLFNNAHSLFELNLFNNSISNLPQEVFDGLKNLRSLDLSSNRIETLDEGVFRDLISLEKLNLYDNLLSELNPNAFENQTKLKSIDLRRNKLMYIPEKIFENCTFLTDINLSQNDNLLLGNYLFNLLYLETVIMTENNLELLPESMFLDCISLKIIDLQLNKLETLPKNIFSNQFMLKDLHLNNNEIRILDDDVFVALRSLQCLSLRFNHLTDISKGLFRNLENLEVLDLSFNQIYTIHSDLFSNKYNLINFWVNNNELNSTDVLPNNLIDFKNIEIIDFSNNKISQFPYELLGTLSELKQHKISTTRLRYAKKPKEIIVNLQNNEISQILYNTFNNAEVPFPPRIRVVISKNPINCDCQALGLITQGRRISDDVILEYDYLLCATPSNLAYTPIEKVDVNTLICPLGKTCTQKLECDCFYKSSTETIVVDCSNRKLSEFPQLVLDDLPTHFDFVTLKRTELHLEDNLLKEGPVDNDVNRKITEFHLQRNDIKSLTWLPPFTEVLRLDNNKMLSLDRDILNSLNDSNIKELSLGNNPWECDCTTKDFINYVLIHNLKIIDSSNVKCFPTGEELISLKEEVFCPPEKKISLTVSLTIVICVSILSISAIIVLYYIYQEEILIWLYARNICLWLVKEERIDQNKKYDAFISFAHQDEDLVMAHLVPNLELATPAYKLCVHIRDWIPGEYIACQISNSVRDSRRTLIILSANFLQSVWGKMEFRIAHTSAMEEGRARVIIVIYGDVQMDQLEDELRAYMRTNTYIKWGDPWFWEKLKYALPRSRRRQ